MEMETNVVGVRAPLFNYLFLISTNIQNIQIKVRYSYLVDFGLVMMKF